MWENVCRDAYLLPFPRIVIPLTSFYSLNLQVRSSNGFSHQYQPQVQPGRGLFRGRAYPRKALNSA